MVACSVLPTIVGQYAMYNSLVQSGPHNLLNKMAYHFIAYAPFVPRQLMTLVPPPQQQQQQ